MYLYKIDVGLNKKMYICYLSFQEEYLIKHTKYKKLTQDTLFSNNVK
jgi:hypothetical protein